MRARGRGAAGPAGPRALTPSVRRRALLGMTAVLTALGLLAAAIAHEVDRADADRLLDDELRQIAFYAGPGLARRAPRRSTYDSAHDILLQIRDAAGALIYSSEPGVGLPADAGPGFGVVVAGDERWRSYTEPLEGGTVQVAQRLSLRHELARTAAWEAALPVLATIPLGWLVVGWGLNQMLASLSRLAATIAARGVGGRAPIPLDGVPGEFIPLVGAMNALIERWRLSLDQQKRFLSDAAHELRTPLTALRLQIELLQRADRRDPAAVEAALPELARGAGRASALVDQLLRMARYDAGASNEAPAAVEMVPLVLRCMADFVALSESKGIDLGLVASEPARLLGVERELHLLVANLIENAVRYTPPGGIVDVGVRLEGGRAVVEVADTGAGIPEELLERVFDRFFRAPGAGAEGTGLGLAICRAIARRHGLALTLANRPAGGLLATVAGPEPR